MNGINVGRVSIIYIFFCYSVRKKYNVNRFSNDNLLKRASTDVLKKSWIHLMEKVWKNTLVYKSEEIQNGPRIYGLDFQNTSKKIVMIPRKIFAEKSDGTYRM